MNTRLSVATHILTLLHSARGEPATSEWLADSVGTHAALVRRLLSRLGAAGLTQARMGAGGGSYLARPADEITLADVYDAVASDADVLPVHATANPRCPVGRRIQGLLERRFSAAQQALRHELAGTTIADLTRDLRRRAAR